MRAVLVATGYRKELEPLVLHKPIPLFKILDKPLIEHILTYLINEGIKRFDIILSHFPEMIEARLEEGHRWGVEICYHICKKLECPFSALMPSASQWEKEPILIVRCDTFPSFEIKEFSKIFWENQRPIFLTYGSKVWTGWAIFPLENFLQIPLLANEENLIELEPAMTRITVKAHPFLAVRTLMDLEKSNQKLLNLSESAKYVPTTAKMVEPGIWMSRAASLHPSVRVRPPVFIGEDCQIKPYAQIGPHVIIENNCVIDQKSTVEESLILQRSYVGEGLEVKNCIIDRNVIINLTHETRVTINDDFILSELKTPSFRQYLLRSLGRYLSAILLVIFAPLFAYLHLTRRLTKTEVLKLPATFDEAGWKTFQLFSYQKKERDGDSDLTGFLTCLPMLFNILMGDLHFTGVRPRTIDEVKKLSTDWKRLYLKSKTGLITLAMVDHGSQPTDDELYASEAFYTIYTGLFYDIKLCLKYIYSFRWLKNN